jgi:hypothetical protein
VKRLLSLCLVLGAASAAAAASAFADTSSNWSGYVATAPGAAFSDVVGSWVQPTATCSGRTAYSAFWVGLGGYGDASQALEQVGTSSDCANGSGPTYSAWYEIIPAPPVAIPLEVGAGDTITAETTASGPTVTLQIRNVTRGTSYSKQLSLGAPDLSSAEWIAEAPSACNGRSCTPLPLANFGTVSFSAASATAAGHVGTISDAAWTATAVSLVTGRAVAAAPSPLSADGASFAVTWQATPTIVLPTTVPRSRGWGRRGWGRHR